MTRFALLIFLVGLGLASGCKNDSQPASTEGVQPIARAILNAVAKSDISEPYQTYFTETYRKKNSLASLQGYVALYHKRHGALIRFQQNFSLSSAADIGGRIEAHVYFDVVWEHGEGQLILQLTKPDEQWRIVDMTLESDAVNQSVKDPLPNIE